MKDLYTTHEFCWVTPWFLWQSIFYRSKKQKQCLPNIFLISVMLEIKMSSTLLKKKVKCFVGFHLPMDSGLIVHTALCQLLRETDCSCTTFCLIYVSTGREVKGKKTTWRAKFFSSFFCCSDNKLAKFVRLQRAPPHPSTRNRQTLLTPAVSAMDLPRTPRLQKAAVRPSWAPTGDSQAMGELLDAGSLGLLGGSLGKLAGLRARSEQEQIKITSPSFLGLHQVLIC